MWDGVFVNDVILKAEIIKNSLNSAKNLTSFMDAPNLIMTTTKSIFYNPQLSHHAVRETLNIQNHEVFHLNGLQNKFSSLIRGRGS